MTLRCQFRWQSRQSRTIGLGLKTRRATGLGTLPPRTVPLRTARGRFISAQTLSETLSARLAAALIAAILLVLAGFADGRSTAAPRPSPVIPDEPFGPVLLAVGGEVPASRLDQARTGVPHLPATPSPGPADSTMLASGFSSSMASWFGPGLYGRRTACGETLTPSLVGVASRTLPCGTKVIFEWAGRVVVAPVVDYGPASWTGRTWDLTFALCSRLARCWTGPVWWRLA